MSITIAGITFDQVEYDAPADVLYLHVGEPSRAVAFDESPEGHALRYDSESNLVGITIVGAKQLLESGSPIVVTIPERVTIDPADLATALDTAA